MVLRLFPMLVIQALFLRPVVRRPWRFLITIAGVATGVAAILSTWASSRAAVASMREGVIDLAGRTRVELNMPGGIPESAVAAFRPVARDAVIAPVVEDFIVIDLLNDTVRLLAVDLLLDSKIRDVELIEERLPGDQVLQKIMRGEGVLLPEALAREINVKTGDTLDVRIHARREKLLIAGLLRPRKMAAAWKRVIITDIGYGQELAGRGARVDRLEFVPRDGVSAESIQKNIESLAPLGSRIGPPSARGAEAGRMVRALEFNLTALSGISLMVGAVLVATTLATSVVQRRSIIALLRSLGATNSQIAGAILLESTMIGLLGGVAGVVAGALGARASMESTRNTMAAVIQGMPASDINIPAWAFAGGILLGIVVSTAASVLPVREALRTPPIQGLRREAPGFLPFRSMVRGIGTALICILLAVLFSAAPPVDGLPYAALLAALFSFISVVAFAAPALDVLARIVESRRAGFLHIVVRAGVAALSAGRTRAAWAAGAVGMAVALAISITTMVGSFRTTIVDYVHQTIRSDVWLRPRSTVTGTHPGGLDPEIVDITIREFGAAAVDPFHRTSALLDGKSITLAAGVFEVAINTAGTPFRDGRRSEDVFRAAIQENGILINEPLARRFALDRGDRLRLKVAGAFIDKPITGVFIDYSQSQGLAVMDRNEFLQILPGDPPTEAGIFLGGDATAAIAGRDRLVRALGNRFDVEVLVNQELRQEALNVFDRTFAVTYALEIISRIVALIGVITVLAALVDERRKDFSMLRAVGASRMQVAAMILCEGGVLGVISIVLGALAGLSVGWILVAVVNVQSFGWTMRFVPPAGAIASICISVVITCAVAALLPALVASRRTPRELLQDDAS